MEAENKQKSNKIWIIILLFIVAAMAVAITLLIISGNRGLKIVDNSETVTIGDAGVPKLGYASGVIALDQDSLQKAVDEMYRRAEEGYFTTEYKNEAYSADGETFSCYIGNSDANSYDMYIQIFADSEYTDQLFLSGLLRPGTAFDTIKLDHPLDRGTHRVYVVYTQVEEDLATLHGQVTVTMDFTVT